MIDLSLFSAGGILDSKSVEGGSKLAQRFILELMTNRGSLLYRANRGSTFFSELASGAIRNELDLFSSFSSALLDVSTALQEEEGEDLEDSERFDEAIVDSFSLDEQGNALLAINITNKAGTTENVTIPLGFNLIG